MRHEILSTTEMDHNKITLYDILERSSVTALALQRADGSMPPGHNGPYYDPETPVRNTSHWLITLLKAFELSQESVFKDAANRAAEYLVSEEARPMKASFWCRKNPEKDFCNGLIGQAWAIEALALASEKLAEPRFGRLAAEVFLMHPFDEKAGLWRRVHVDGSYGSFDLTFNHQLWFAASGSLLSSERGSQIESRVNRFMDVLPHHMDVHRSGLICHSIGTAYATQQALRRFPTTILRMLWRTQNLKSSQARVAKEIGYHAFNLYGLTLLKSSVPDHAFWCSDKFKAALHYIRRDEFVRSLETNGNDYSTIGANDTRHSFMHNRYGYAYNPPGFEVAFALHVFSPFFEEDVTPLISSWVSEQIRRCYDFDTNLMDKNTEDPPTLAARLYEAIRLPDVELQLDWPGHSPASPTRL